jgi:hypothetical protein
MLEELNDNLQQADGQEETTSVENHTPISEDTEIENEVLEATENETISEKLEEETTVSVQDEIDNHLAEASEEGSIETDLEIEVKDYEKLSLEERNWYLLEGQRCVKENSFDFSETNNVFICFTNYMYQDII